jgi:hypothetical protein
VRQVTAFAETTNLSFTALDAKRQCLDPRSRKGASGLVLFFAPLGRGLWSSLGFDAPLFLGGKSMANAQLRLRGDIRPIDCTESLHVLKAGFQKKHMAQQCKDLCGCLDLVIKNTRKAAPVRRNPYLVHRESPRLPADPEAKWEEAVFKKWTAAGAEPIPGAWHRIVTYQVNLPDTRANRGWGEIDLLGVSDVGLPVVIELKAPAAADTPPAFLVQAVAYAIAIQRAWPNRLATEWSNKIAQAYDLQITPSRALQMCPVVCAAPREFWDCWIGQSNKARTVKPKTWDAFRRLVGAFAARGFPATFVRLDHTGLSETGFPEGLSAEILHLFN